MQGVLTATAFMETLGISVTKECDLASYMNFRYNESKFEIYRLYKLYRLRIIYTLINYIGYILKEILSGYG